MCQKYSRMFLSDVTLNQEWGKKLADSVVGGKRSVGRGGRKESY